LITATITVEVRDGRYRILFTDPIYKEYSVNTYGQRGGGFTGGDKSVTIQAMADNIKKGWINLSQTLKESVQKDSSW
jgi:hypothetical protein